MYLTHPRQNEKLRDRLPHQKEVRLQEVPKG